MGVFHNRQNTEDPPKHKRRTPPHRKNSAYPGMRLNTKEFIVQSGSIKSISGKEGGPTKIQESKRVVSSDPLWVAYDEWIKKINDTNIHAIEATQGLRNNLEQRYALAYQALVREGKAQQIRGKYRLR